MDERYPDRRAFTAQCLQAMFDSAALLRIDDGAALPRTEPPESDPDAVSHKKRTERMERAVIDGLVGKAVPYTIAYELVQQFKVAVKNAP